jgi:hypothetical protein
MVYIHDSPVILLQIMTFFTGFNEWLSNFSYLTACNYLVFVLYLCEEYDSFVVMHSNRNITTFAVQKYNETYL